MSELPGELERLIDRVLSEAKLDEERAREVRADLVEHFRDGLDAGRTPAQLADRFGDPRRAAMRYRQDSPEPLRTGSDRLHGLRDDMRNAVRRLLRSPVQSITVAVVLALGVGVSTLVSSIVNALLLEPIPVHDPSTLVDVWSDVPGGNSFLAFSYEEFRTYRESGVLPEVAAFSGTTLALGDDDSEVSVVAMVVTPKYLDMLGIRPHLGSTSLPRDDAFGAPSGVVVSHAFWRDGLGEDPAAVGSTLRLGGQNLTVLGVAQEGFSGHFIGFPSELFVPVSAAPLVLEGFDPTDRGQQIFEMIGRVHAGTSPDAVRQGLNRVAAEIEREYPEMHRGARVGVTRTTGLDHSLHAGVVTFAAVLSVVSLLVLGIACLNAGGILLAHGLARNREVAVRLALGAGRARLARGLLVEALLLAAVGAGVGAVLASRANLVLSDWLRSVSGGRLGLDLGIDATVLAWTGAAAVLAALLSSAAPAVQLTGQEPAHILRSRGGPGREGARTRGALIVGQVAVSVVLAVVAGLFGRSLSHGARVDPGFDADRVASFTLDFDSARIGRQEPHDVLTGLIAGLSGTADVEAVTWSNTPPLAVARTPTRVRVPDVEPPPDQDDWIVDSRRVGPGYLATVGIGLRHGRDFAALDLESAGAVVVSRAFADRFWPGQAAVGRSFDLDGAPARVVGVAEDARYLLQDDTPDPLVYLAETPARPTRPLLVVRSRDAARLQTSLTTSVRALVPAHPPVVVRTARSSLLDALLPQRSAAVLIGVMGTVAFVLAALGLYGLVQFTVARDTPVLGVRRALGATRADLIRVVLRGGFTVAGAGVLVGLALTLAGAGFLRSLLPGVSPYDPLTYVAASVLFGVVTLAAAGLPALRAGRIAPTEALREG